MLGSRLVEAAGAHRLAALAVVLAFAAFGFYWWEAIGVLHTATGTGSRASPRRRTGSGGTSRRWPSAPADGGCGVARAGAWRGNSRPTVRAGSRWRYRRRPGHRRDRRPEPDEQGRGRADLAAVRAWLRSRPHSFRGAGGPPASWCRWCSRWSCSTCSSRTGDRQPPEWSGGERGQPLLGGERGRETELLARLLRGGHHVPDVAGAVSPVTSGSSPPPWPRATRQATSAIETGVPEQTF